MYMCINHGPELSPNPDRHANHGPAHTGPGTAHTNNFNGFEHNGSPESGGGTKKKLREFNLGGDPILHRKDCVPGGRPARLRAAGSPKSGRLA